MKKKRVVKRTAPKPSTKQARIFIVDDHPICREGLAVIIRQQPDMILCGEADTAANAFEQIPRAKPDIVLTDIGLPGKSGLELLKDLHAILPGLPVLVISMHDEGLYAERALHAGARRYIMKQEVREKIVQAITRVLGGQVYVSEKISAGILDRIVSPVSKSATSPVGNLTEREFEVFRFLGAGQDGHQIASSLHLSLKTVNVHKTHIREKLGLKNSIAVIHFATRWLADA